MTFSNKKRTQGKSNKIMNYNGINEIVYDTFRKEQDTVTFGHIYIQYLRFVVGKDGERRIGRARSICYILSELACLFTGLKNDFEVTVSQ